MISQIKNNYWYIFCEVIYLLVGQLNGRIDGEFVSQMVD